MRLHFILNVRKMRKLMLLYYLHLSHNVINKAVNMLF